MREIEESVEMISAELANAEHVMTRDARDLEVLPRVMRMRMRSMVRRKRSVRRRRRSRSVKRIEREARWSAIRGQKRSVGCQRGGGGG